MIDGNSSNDKPLAFHWRSMDESWIDGLHLPAASSKAYVRARASIVLEAMITARSESPFRKDLSGIRGLLIPQVGRP
jgi:hypothetical protein